MSVALCLPNTPSDDANSVTSTTLSRPSPTSPTVSSPMDSAPINTANIVPNPGNATLSGLDTAIKRKPSRRANTAERRATHNAVERQRRETLNGRFLDLAALLPNLATVRRPSKSAIVNSSIALIHSQRRARVIAGRELRALEAESDALRRQVNEWRARSGAALPALQAPTRSPEFTAFVNASLNEEDDGGEEERRAYALALVREEGDEEDDEDVWGATTNLGSATTFAKDARKDYVVGVGAGATDPCNLPADGAPHMRAMQTMVQRAQTHPQIFTHSQHLYQQQQQQQQLQQQHIPSGLHQGPATIPPVLPPSAPGVQSQAPAPAHAHSLGMDADRLAQWNAQIHFALATQNAAMLNQQQQQQQQQQQMMPTQVPTPITPMSMTATPLSMSMSMSMPMQATATQVPAQMMRQQRPPIEEWAHQAAQAAALFAQGQGGQQQYDADMFATFARQQSANGLNTGSNATPFAYGLPGTALGGFPGTPPNVGNMGFSSPPSTGTGSVSAGSVGFVASPQGSSGFLSPPRTADGLGGGDGPGAFGATPPATTAGDMDDFAGSGTESSHGSPRGSSVSVRSSMSSLRSGGNGEFGSATAAGSASGGAGMNGTGNPYTAFSAATAAAARAAAAATTAAAQAQASSGGTAENEGVSGSRRPSLSIVSHGLGGQGQHQHQQRHQSHLPSVSPWGGASGAVSAGGGGGGLTAMGLFI